MSKITVVASFGLAIMSIMLVQAMGPALISLTTTVDFQITVPDRVYAIGEPVPFNITNIQGNFLKFVWFFHDGSTNVTSDGSVTNLTHTFTVEGQYLVGVYAFTTTSYNYPIDLLRTALVTVRNTPPALSITANTTTVFEASPIHFSIHSFTDPNVDTSTATYQWDFGDGVNTTGTSVDHTFTNAGTYNVLTYATDRLGQVAVASTAIMVAGQAPTIHVTENATSILEGQAVQFNASQTTAGPAEEPSLTYGWTFGNGDLGTGTMVTETYEHPGYYTAVLTVRDQLGATVSQSIPIHVSNVPPTFMYAALNQQVVSEGQAVIGHAQAVDAPVDSSRLIYNWTLGTTTQTGQIVSWTPFQPENTTANLTVTDTSNATTSTSLPVTVLNVPPQASIVGVQMNFNLTVIITGDKWKAITIQLLNENNATIINNTLVRQAGDPWAMDLTFYNVSLDLSHVWRFVTEYTPNSTATNGADPVSLYLNLTNANAVYYKVYNFTFNVQQPTWYTWVLPLDPFTNGLPVGWLINYFDPGTTALTIALDHTVSASAIIPATLTGPQHGTLVLYAALSANQSNPIILSITDQYGVTNATAYQVDAPLGAAQGYRVSALAPEITNFTTTTSYNRTTMVYSGYEYSRYNFTITAIPFYQDLSGLQYVWSFGDGQTLTTTNTTITHLFTYAGSYEVIVQVQSLGTMLTTKQGILVVIHPQPPSIQLVHPLGQGAEIGMEVTFDVSKTTAVPSEQPLQFFWSFRDKAGSIVYTGYTAQITREFYQSGTYIGTVFVVGAEGIIVNKTFPIWVQDPLPQATINTKFTGSEGKNIIFDPQVTDSAVQIPLLQYQWYIGSDIYNQKFVDRYFLAGTYNGFFIVRDPEGQLSNTSFTVMVLNTMPRVAILPQYDYGVKPNNFRLVLTIQANNLDFGSLEYTLGTGSWQPIQSNIINATVDLSGYQDGLNYTVIQLKDRSGTSPPQYISFVTFGDRNGDNILDSNKTILGLSPTSADTDTDGISDFTELTGWDISVTYLGQTTPTTIHVSSDPTNPETNGCIPDNIMYRLQGNPRIFSTAGDGISDCQKYLHGLPLNVAINPGTHIEGYMYVNSTATDASTVYGVEASITEVVTGNYLLSYSKNTAGELIPATNVLQFYNTTNYYLGSCTVNATGMCSLTYARYQPAIIVKYIGNEIYHSANTTLYPSYDIGTMLKTLSPVQNQFFTPDPVASARAKLFRNYVEYSGAFQYDSNSQTYTMTKDTKFYWTQDLLVNVGYQLNSPVSFTAAELLSGNYQGAQINVTHTYSLTCYVPIIDLPYACDQQNKTLTLSKESFLNLWLNLKIHHFLLTDNAPVSSQLTDLDTLIQNFLTISNANSNSLPQVSDSNNDNASMTVSVVQLKLKLATSPGFTQPNIWDTVLTLLVQYVPVIGDAIHILTGYSVDSGIFEVNLWNIFYQSILNISTLVVKDIAAVQARMVVPDLNIHFDPNVQPGSSAFIWDVTLRSYQGLLVTGPIHLQIYDPSSGIYDQNSLLYSGTIDNGSISLPLNTYYPQLQIITSGHSFYIDGKETISPTFNIRNIIRQGIITSYLNNKGIFELTNKIFYTTPIVQYDSSHGNWYISPSITYSTGTGPTAYRMLAQLPQWDTGNGYTENEFYDYCSSCSTHPGRGIGILYPDIQMNFTQAELTTISMMDLSSSSLNTLLTDLTPTNIGNPANYVFFQVITDQKTSVNYNIAYPLPKSVALWFWIALKMFTPSDFITSVQISSIISYTTWKEFVIYVITSWEQTFEGYVNPAKKFSFTDDFRHFMAAGTNAGFKIESSFDPLGFISTILNAVTSLLNNVVAVANSVIQIGIQAIIDAVINPILSTILSSAPSSLPPDLQLSNNDFMNMQTFLTNTFQTESATVKVSVPSLSSIPLLNSPASSTGFTLLDTLLPLLGPNLFMTILAQAGLTIFSAVLSPAINTIEQELDSSGLINDMTAMNTILLSGVNQQALLNGNSVSIGLNAKTTADSLTATIRDMYSVITGNTVIGAISRDVIGLESVTKQYACNVLNTLHVPAPTSNDPVALANYQAAQYMYLDKCVSTFEDVFVKLETFGILMSSNAQNKNNAGKVAFSILAFAFEAIELILAYKADQAYVSANLPVNPIVYTEYLKNIFNFVSSGLGIIGSVLTAIDDISGTQTFTDLVSVGKALKIFGLVILFFIVGIPRIINSFASSNISLGESILQIAVSIKIAFDIGVSFANDEIKAGYGAIIGGVGLILIVASTFIDAIAWFTILTQGLG